MEKQKRIKMSWKKKNMSSNLTTEKSLKHLWSSMVLITALAPKGGWHRIHLQSAKSCQIFEITTSSQLGEKDIYVGKNGKNDHVNCTNATY